MFSAHADVARDLLIRLLEETERARAPQVAANIEAFDKVLADRGEMLEALERSVQALATASMKARSAGNPSARASLLELASELERANAQLVDSVRVERDLIAAALAAADRPDAIATRYAGPVPELPQFDLVR